MNIKFPVVINLPAAAAPQPRKRGYLPLWIMGSACFIAIWGGWVSLGGLTGFGPVELFPGIWPAFKPNTAITLPLSMEVYGSYALRWWIDKRTPKRARAYAMWTALSALVLGMAAQAGTHLLEAALKSGHWSTVPWPITMVVAWVPVIVFGLGAGLHHMLNDEEDAPREEPAGKTEETAAPAANPEPAPAAPGPVPVHVHPAPAAAPWGLVSPAPVAGPPVPGTPVPVLGPVSRLADRPAPQLRRVRDEENTSAKQPLPEGEELRRVVAELGLRELTRRYEGVTRYRAGQLKELLAAGQLGAEVGNEDVA